MKVLTLSLVLLQTSSVIAAACRRDDCYKQVAGQGRENPGLAARRSNCRSIIVTAEDDVTVTVTATSTTLATSSSTRLVSTKTDTSTSVISFTTTKSQSFTIDTKTTSVTVVSTATDVVQGFLNRQVRDVANRAAAAYAMITAVPRSLLDDASFADLVERDKIVASGVKPSYASSCRNLQAFVTACLCWGVPPITKARSTATVTVSSTSTLTISGTATATLTSSVSVTKTSSTTFFITDTKTSTLTSTTTTTTTSAQQAPPTCFVLFDTRAQSEKRVVMASNYNVQLVNKPADPVEFMHFGANQQPFNEELPNAKLYVVRQSSTMGYLIFIEGAPSATQLPVLCDAPGNGVATCVGTGAASSFDTFYLDSAGGSGVYLGTKTASDSNRAKIVFRAEIVD